MLPIESNDKGRPEIHHTRIYRMMRRWQADGSIERIFAGTVNQLHQDQLLKLSVIHGDGMTTAAKKGGGNLGYSGHTHIGNEYFAWFQSSCSKSRINFLELLRAGHGDWQINEDALAYMKTQGLSLVFLDALRQHESVSFADQCAWWHHLDGLGVNTPRYRNIATEGALLGSLKRHGVAAHLAIIISDDAGQFNVRIHGLCWVHAERLVHKMLPLNE